MKCGVFLGAMLSLIGCAPQGMSGAKGDPGAPGHPGRDAYVTGSRLEARLEGGDDGSRAFAGWYDSKLNVDCQFDRAADGVTRCLPYSRDTINVPVVVYTDQDCTAPVLGFKRLCDNPAGAVPEYIRYLEKSMCGGWHVRAVGDQLDNNEALFAWDESGQCSTAPVMFGPLFALEGEMPPDSFVQGGTGLE